MDHTKLQPMDLSTKNSGRWVLAGLAGVVLLITACGSQQQKHQMLTFFFDGVPDPGSASSPVPTGEAEMVEKKRRGFVPVVRRVIFHEPFELKDCKDCHKSAHSQALVKDEPRLCYDCHGKILKKMTFVHKPAEDGTCKACHLPHKSPYDFLLPKPEVQLCNDCHDPVNTLAFVHTPIADGHCSVCHDPHGGKNAMYLKAEADAHCAQCHEPEKMMVLEAHQHVGEQRCMDCHDPHQSDIKGLLRAKAL